MIGSTRWRLTNYGPIATIDYIINEKILKNRKKRWEYFENSFQYKQVKNIFELSKTLFFDFGIEVNSDLVEKDVENFIQQIKEKNVLSESKITSKSLESLLGSKTRFYVLASLLSTRKFTNVLEVGTQHGSTSSLMGKLSESVNLKVTTFDVVKQEIYLPHQNVKYRVIEKNVRKNMKETLNSWKEKDTIFFHDSDHSYENMKFEFQLAWKNPYVTCLVSDDIDNNDAFIDFVEKHELKPIIAHLDLGPRVGIVMKKSK